MTTPLLPDFAGARHDVKFAQALQANIEKYNGYADVATLILGSGDDEADASSLSRETRRVCTVNTLFVPIVTSLFSVNPLIGMVAGAILLGIGNGKFGEGVTEGIQDRNRQVGTETSNLVYAAAKDSTSDSELLERFNSTAPREDEIRDATTITRDELKVEIAKLAAKRFARVDERTLAKALELVSSK